MYLAASVGSMVPPELITSFFVSFLSMAAASCVSRLLSAICFFFCTPQIPKNHLSLLHSGNLLLLRFFVLLGVRGFGENKKTLHNCSFIQGKLLLYIDLLFSLSEIELALFYSEIKFMEAQFGELG
ncbi:hypothetical protein VNO78_23439 [Psophocarpus tetragonolobus]|uniref:Uncharacterized protein n=1 Tax=Psophocarpus tetragonolobus TaxID=3891 RepID=A0AAN9XDV2_PSOTE